MGNADQLGLSSLNMRAEGVLDDVGEKLDLVAKEYFPAEKTVFQAPPHSVVLSVQGDQNIAHDYFAISVQSLAQVPSQIGLPGVFVVVDNDPGFLGH